MNENLKINLDPSQGRPVLCGNCKNDEFITTSKLTYFSPILTGTSKPLVVPMQVLRCSKCNKEITDDDLTTTNQATELVVENL